MILNLLFAIQWATIIFSLVGLFYIAHVINITRTTKLEVIKARVFLDDRFLMHSMYLLAVICFLFIVHALSEYVSIYKMEIMGFTLTKLLKESTELGVLISAVLMSRSWHLLLAGIDRK